MALSVKPLLRLHQSAGPVVSCRRNIHPGLHRLPAKAHDMWLIWLNSFISTEDKIAKMEAKLRQLEQPPSSLVGHPSLPPKPVVLPSSFDAPSTGGATAQHRRNATPLPALPLAPPSQRHPLPQRPAEAASAPLHVPPRPPRKATPSLLGVKFKKHKDAPSPSENDS